MKKWYKSRTLWVNLIAALAFFAQAHYGFGISPEIQAYILTALNVALRFDTDRPLGT